MQTIAPIIMFMLIVFVIFGMFKMVAPRIAGIAKIKAKSIASSFLIPMYNAPVIVEPDLLIPGRIANAWKRPIIKADLGLILVFSLGLSEKYSSMLVSINDTPTIIRLLNIDWM